MKGQNKANCGDSAKIITLNGRACCYKFIGENVARDAVINEYCVNISRET